jgi:hypothetical protein
MKDLILGLSVSWVLHLDKLKFSRDYLENPVDLQDSYVVMGIELWD